MIKETTIAAIASGTGIAGVGVIRISGELSYKIAQAITGLETIKPRYAHYCAFKTGDGSTLDQGIVLYFNQPNSFTGEDVIELQGHGGLVVLTRILKRIYELGAIPANAGEFSQRAFLNGKLDLIQAEAIHDLIVSQSEAQAAAAINSLTGIFSQKIHTLFEALVTLRVYVEASIDFSEEDIDFIADGHVLKRLMEIKDNTEALLNSANQGQLLTDGLHVVLAGKPNAGKSSLLNALSGEESAIVTDIAGTTRDLLKETIIIQGVPLHIIDTAGLRKTEDIIEKEGVKRALKAIEKADLILWVHDDQMQELDKDEALNALNIPTIHVRNKIDLSDNMPGMDGNTIMLSAKTSEGISLLQDKILEMVSFTPKEGLFSARARHLNALKNALNHLNSAHLLLTQAHSIEIVAEEFRLALNALASITGEFTTDDLLGEIFSNFCVGK